MSRLSLVLLVAVAAGSPHVALAHDAFGDLGPFYGALLHPLADPAQKAGRERQNYALADMFFSPEELVFRISQDMTLEPGDVILCGTSLGALPMKPGTAVEVVIDGLGSLRNVYG